MTPGECHRLVPGALVWLLADAAVASGGPGYLPAGDSAPERGRRPRGPGSGAFHAIGVQLGIGHVEGYSGRPIEVQANYR